MRILLAALALAAMMPPPAPAQHEGPLIIKPRPRRPPRAEPPPEPAPAPARRPQLKRKSGAEPAEKPASGPCPAGYIAVEAAPLGDERPPVLRRGGAAEEKPAPAAEEPRVECVFAETVVDEEGHVIEERGGGAAGPSGDPFIEEARAAVFEFSETLPDFTCRQVTTRYSSNSRGEKWKRRDRIEADVLFLRGRERYQNIRRNGKPVKKDPRYSGSWSMGEFGTLLQDLFHPRTAAQFEPAGNGQIGGHPVRIYDYRVAARTSHWKVSFEGNRLQPAYEGSVWIDPETKRVLRVEMKAVEIPDSYPLDRIEMASEYGPVRIGGAEYILITRSENLSCKRYSAACTRNEIQFLDYRKFTAESTISTVDTNVTYEGQAEGAEAPPDEPKKKEQD